MPHQCLSCGFAFQEGSSALLKGCPECKGTRFFYSAAAVDDVERKQIAADAQKDLRQVVTDMLTEASPEARKTLEDTAGADGWATLKPRDLRRLVKQVQADAKRVDAPAPAASSGPTETSAETKARMKVVEAARKRILAEMAEKQEEKPDTVTVGDGEYNIDVKGLLEKNPIVVQKDGAYLIHLPSLFEGKE